MEIPKVIHYCWFGGNPLPPLAHNCIQSWKQYFPEYEIKEWNESNFDVNSINYIKQAYEARKYAFVSDYARFKILYDNGGIYFDTDVEVIKPMYDIIATGPFMGCENNFRQEATPNELGVNPGLGMGAPAGFSLFKELLILYDNLQFRKKDGSLNTKTIVEYTTDFLSQKGLKNISEIQNIDGINIYPKDYFCPQDYKTGKITITANTYSIHHFAESWHGKKEKLYKTVKSIFGEQIAQIISNTWKRFKE